MNRQRRWGGIHHKTIQYIEREREKIMIERREFLPTSVLLAVELSHNGCSN